MPAHTLQLVRPVRPRAVAPVLPIRERMDRERVGVLREALAEGTLPMDHGPYRDCDRQVKLYLSRVAARMPSTLDDALLLLLFEFTPLASSVSWASLDLTTLPFVVEPRHIHASAEPMAAGELLLHSQSEPGSPPVMLQTDDELVVLAVAVMRRLGYLHAYPAHVPKGGQFLSSLLILDESGHATSVVFGVPHPSTQTWEVFDDREMLQRLEVARMENTLRWHPPSAKA